MTDPEALNSRDTYSATDPPPAVTAVLTITWFAPSTVNVEIGGRSLTLDNVTRRVVDWFRWIGRESGVDVVEANQHFRLAARP